VAAGFGISMPEQVAHLRRLGADGAIVGSGILRRVAEGADEGEIRVYVRSLKLECR